jgi:hypothetical protein
MKRKALAAIAVCLLVLGLLSFVSYYDTALNWHQSFPPAEVRLNVVDEAGAPVSGAELQIFSHEDEQVFDWPFVEQIMVSDASGGIVCHQIHYGVQYGGTSWELFWIIPMGSDKSPYKCRIVREGFQPLTFRLTDLFELNGFNSKENAIFEVNGTKQRLLIFERKYTMKKA